MNPLKIFCITVDPNHLTLINKINYLPVGLGNHLFTKEWITDNSNENISNKNKFYGEYTFHYWLWKNNLNKLPDGWIGFCQYRKFWCVEDIDVNNITFEKFQKSILKEIPPAYDKFDSIIGSPTYVNKFKLSKFVKHNLKTMLRNPNLFLDKNKRNIKFHFDMMHGKNNLDKAIELLDLEDRNDFRDFVNTNTSFNPHNMFICKSKEILSKYYDCIFPWLFRCEKLFNFDNLHGYGLQRIYGFLAERYLSYWFQKNTNYKTMPIIHKDITDYLN